MPKNDESGIFVTIRFWTDFEDNKGNKIVVPKQGWAAGTLRVRASKLHDIKADKVVVFNNLEELMVKLDKLLRQHEITLVISNRDELAPRLGKSYPKNTWTTPTDFSHRKSSPET